MSPRVFKSSKYYEHLRLYCKYCHKLWPKPSSSFSAIYYRCSLLPSVLLKIRDIKLLFVLKHLHVKPCMNHHIWPEFMATHKLPTFCTTTRQKANRNQNLCLDVVTATT